MPLWLTTDTSNWYPQLPGALRQGRHPVCGVGQIYTMWWCVGCVRGLSLAAPVPLSVSHTLCAWGSPGGGGGGIATKLYRQPLAHTNVVVACCQQRALLAWHHVGC